jgi:hypothetical protein
MGWRHDLRPSTTHAVTAHRCARSLRQTCPVPSEDDDFEQALEAMRDIWIEASGGSHGHLDALLDPAQRRDPATTNYLASGASGTLRDRFFSPMNGDHVAEADQARINSEYRALLDSATESAKRLSLPAVRDL